MWRTIKRTVFLMGTAGAAHASMVSMTLNVTNPLYTGTFEKGAVSFTLNNTSGSTLLAPITFKTRLPQGVSMAVTPYTWGAWTCSAGVDPRDVTCVRGTNFDTVNFTSAGQFHLTVAANAPIGNFILQGTVENAQYPLPQPLVCVTGNGGTTQCSEDSGNIVQSSVRVTDMDIWSDDVLTPGATEQLRIKIANVGYDSNNGAIRLRVHWPAGVTLASAGASPYVSGCAAVPGQPSVSECAVSATVVSTTWNSFSVNVASNFPTGVPVRFVYEIGNFTPQSRPWDTATDCLADINQIGCYEAFYTAVPPPAPNLEITSMSHDASVLPIQDDAGSLTVAYRNRDIGNTVASGDFGVSFQLPPGFSYRSLSPGTGYALTACTATGTAVLGQTVRCTRSVGLPLNGTGSGVIRVDIARGMIPDRNSTLGTVVASISTATDYAAQPNLLVDCASTPQTPQCELHDIPFRGGCMDYAEDVYCNGYE